MLLLLPYSSSSNFLYVIDKSVKVVNSLIAYMGEWATHELEKRIEFHPPSADLLIAIYITLFSLSLLTLDHIP
jgi:hypothetical protein